MFWRSAFRWGCVCGVELIAVNLIGLFFELETNASWVYELLMMAVLVPLILYAGRRNAASATPSVGYTYGRAIGFVFAAMLFAGVVYGLGKWLIINFVGPEYYAALHERLFENMLTVYNGTPMMEQMIDMRDMMLGMMRGPVFLVFQTVVELVFKGGFLGLVLCSFVVRRPDIFAGGDGQ